MRNKTWSVLSYVLVYLMLAAIACKGGVPSTQPPTSQENLPSPVVAAPTQALVQPDTAGLDGEWNGKTSAGTDFLIQVKDNQVTYFNFSYEIQSGSCSASVGLGDMVNVPLVDNKFAIEWKSEAEAVQVTITGTLGADGQASGTVDYSAKNPVCGDIHTSFAWNALSESATAAGSVVVAPSDQSSGQVGYDGSWDGTNSEGNQVSFKVENNQVKSIILNYSVNTNGCFYSGASGGPTENGTISDKSFSVNYTDSDGNLFTFSGSFTSDTEAAGTFHVKGSASGFCGAFETDMNWTAKNTTAAAIPADTNPVSTVGVSGNIDPIAVVNGYFDAINQGDIDTAFTFLDENLIFKFGSKVSGVGNIPLRMYLTSPEMQGITYTLSNYKAVGDAIVKFTAQASDSTTYTKGLAMLDKGKIVNLSLEK